MTHFKTLIFNVTEKIYKVWIGLLKQNENESCTNNGNNCWKWTNSNSYLTEEQLGWFEEQKLHHTNRNCVVIDIKSTKITIESRKCKNPHGYGVICQAC